MASPVRLAVYDISHGWARVLSPFLFCKRIELAPHTSILIFGREYFWGGGIQKCAHEDFVEQFGAPPVEIVELGHTEITEDLFHDFILTVSTRYTQNTYDLLKNNCNAFSQECAQFLLGESIPAHILAAPEIVLRSCLGRVALALLSLTPPARVAVTLALQWALALVGLACLASTSAASACPVGAGDDPTVNFGVVAFALDLAYTTSMLIALGRAARYQQLACWARPWVESLSSLLLAFLGYSAAVGVSTLETSMHRLFPSDCTHAHANFRKLSAGCAFLWLLLIASFLPRLFLIRVHNVLCDLTKSGTFSEVSQDATADPEREQLGRTLEMSRQMPATLV